MKYKKRKFKKLILCCVLVVTLVSSLVLPSFAAYNYMEFSKAAARYRDSSGFSDLKGYYSNGNLVAGSWFNLDSNYDEPVYFEDFTWYFRFPETIAAGDTVRLSFSFWIGVEDFYNDSILLSGSTFIPQRGDAYYSSNGVLWGADFQDVSYSVTHNWNDIVPCPNFYFLADTYSYYTYTMEWTTSIATNMVGIYLYAPVLYGHIIDTVEFCLDTSSIRYSESYTGGGTGGGTGGDVDTGDSSMKPGDIYPGQVVSYQYRNNIDSPVTSPNFPIDDVPNHKYYTFVPSTSASMYRLTHYYRFQQSLPKNVDLNFRVGFWVQMLDSNGNPITYNDNTWKFEYGLFTDPGNNNWITDINNVAVNGVIAYKSSSEKPCPSVPWLNSSSYAYYELEYTISTPANSNGLWMYVYPNSSAAMVNVSNVTTVVDYCMVSYPGGDDDTGSGGSISIDWPKPSIPEVDTGIGNAGNNLHDSEVELWEQFESAYDSIDFDFSTAIAPFLTSLNWFNQKVALMFYSNGLISSIVTICLVFGAFSVLLGFFDGSSSTSKSSDSTDSKGGDSN